jgi:molybdopterin converting factor small subunit
MSLPTITIELYGMARMRAGQREIVVSAATVGDAVAAVAQVCPALAEICRPDGQLAPQYLLSLDGERFLADQAHPLQAGDKLLLLSADAGG